MKSHASLLALLALMISPALAQDDTSATSLNSEIQVLPAPGPVTIDGTTNDWDLSAGVWSYNDPTLVQKNSVWTHLMWDQKGVYFLARYYDKSPMQNATMGKDFAKSWQADAYQARVIFDDGKPDEHQMHVNLFYSTPEKRAYMLVKHGGFKATAPFDETGPDRPDLLERFSNTMDKAGGEIAFRPWDDGKGYNLEAFWPWSYDRLSGQPLKPGDQFTFGIEAMWGTPDGTAVVHRLADGIKNDKVNRIFMFRARNGWGKAIISAKGHLDITAQQEALEARRLKHFVDYDSYGTIPLPYTIAQDGDVTLAIDNATGVRVRNLIGQYPRKAGKNQELWDGLDDNGKPVPAGKYTVTVLDHQPVGVKFYNSLYNAATPPWRTETGMKNWGANHGYPTTAATRGATTMLGFTGTEGASGIMKINADGIIQWTDTSESVDITLDDKYAYSLNRDSWTQRTLLRRFNLTTGRLTPWDNETKSPDAVLVPSIKGIPDSSSLAFINGTLVAHIPGIGVFQIHPTTGNVTQLPANADLVAVTDREDKAYGLWRNGDITEIDAAGKAGAKLLTAKGLTNPVRLAVRQDGGAFAISDGTTNQVLVLDPKGRQIRAIGKAYTAVDALRPGGKFIDTDLINPVGLDFDAQGRLWVAEASKASKRITTWTPDGKLQHAYWGAADYGAMQGFPIIADPTRFIAHGVEFKLDPNPDPWHKPTEEKALIFHPELAERRGFVYTIKGHDYAVNTPSTNGDPGPITIFLRDKDGVFKPCVRYQVSKRTLKDGKWIDTPGYGWVDLNGNGKEDPEEITPNVPGRRAYWSSGWVGPDLTIMTQDCYSAKSIGFTKSGVPTYDFSKITKAPNAVEMMDGQGSVGTMIMDTAGNISDGIRYRTIDGRSGAYPNRYGRHDAPAAQRGTLIAPFRTNGVVENVPAVGSITALGGDRGEWFLMTMDGLYISSILQDSKADVTLDETFTGQESFGGFLWRGPQGKIRVQLGGASYRLMELTNLDTLHKQQFTLDVSAAQIADGVTFAGKRLAAANSEPAELHIAKVATLPTAPVSPSAGADQALIPNGADFRVQEAGNPGRWFRASLAHDGTNLAISYQVNDPNPWKNAEGRFTHAFIGGDSVDLKLDIPGRGPIRLLTAPVSGENVAVYWQKTAPQPDNPLTYVVGNNLANAQKFDVVRRLTSAKIAVQKGDTGYSVLITLPLTDLGLAPATPDMKGTVGVIYSDPSGTTRAARLYWFDKSTGLVSDVPSESALDVSKWGKIVLDK